MANKLTGIKGFGEGDPKPERSSKHSALKKRTSDKKSPVKLHRTHVSDDYCSTCGVKMSRMERYESGHNHYDD